MEYNVFIFGLHLKLKPVAFTLPIGNGWNVYWYGIIVATGFLLAVIYGFQNAKRYNINTDRMTDVILITTPLAVLCARAYYVIFDDYKIHSIKEFFGFSSSSGFAGIAIYGGVIGALGFGTLACYLRKLKILDMYDIALTAFLIGQGIGRWGNFVNQEAFGGFTNSSFWGMESENTIEVMKGTGLVHPCFLYESVWCIAGFFVLHFLSKRRKYSGQISLCYGVWYGFGRGFIELLRTDSLMLGKVRVSSLLSFAACFICAAALVYIHIRMKKKSFVKQNCEEGVADVQTD